MVSPLLNDLRNPILSSFFLLSKFLQSFLISGGFSFDCFAVAGAFELLIGFVEAAVAGAFQVSIGFVPSTVCFAPTAAEVGYFVYRCRWWNFPVCFGRCLFRIGGG